MTFRTALVLTVLTFLTELLLMVQLGGRVLRVIPVAPDDNGGNGPEGHTAVAPPKKCGKQIEKRCGWNTTNK